MAEGMGPMAAATKRQARSGKTEDLRALNAAFYRARPQDYFGRRLQNLILVAGNLAGLDELFSRGVKYGSLSVIGPDLGTLGATEAAKAEREVQRQRFVIAESEVLCHHVGETLLRLYLAHEGRPTSPWLELSKERTPGEFKKKVRMRFVEDAASSNPDWRAEIARMFYLSEDRHVVQPSLTEEEWGQNLANIEGYLRYFAHQFLDRAALYNAGKHGLALIPGELSFHLEDGSVLGADGPIIEYLDLRQDHGGRRWHHVAHWVNSERQITLIYIATCLVAELWEGGRRYYAPNGASPTRRAHWFAKTSVEDLMRLKRGRPVEVEEMALPLAGNL
jgi:hypothetical protein